MKTCIKPESRAFLPRNLLALSIMAVLCPLSVQAQDADTEDDAVRVIDEIVVTGTAGGAEIRKFDASYAITTTDSEEINKVAPSSTADLLKVVPGVWSESSGGVSGANVFVRGFPGTGDAPFLTVQVNGSPIFPPPTLSFLENSTLFRLDETVERMEALRGGPNPVLSNGQPGLTTNFILKEGGPETEGLVKYTGSDYDLRRFDGVISGEISDGFYYMVGGYIKSSPGVRDAGFNSEEGQQLTINLTKDLENGSFNLFHRVTDDHGVWYLPAALNVPGIDASYTQIGTLNRQRTIMFSDYGSQKTASIDLGEGRGWVGSMTGGSASFDLSNGWEFVDRFSYTAGDADTLGLVPNGGAVNVGALLADPSLDVGAVVTGPLTGMVTGAAISNADYIQQFGAWEVRKDIAAFVNDVSIAKQWDDKKLTLGFYSANSSSDEFWSLGNQKYYVVRSGGEMIDGVACNDPAVDSCGWNYDINATGDATTNALYVAGEYDVTQDLSVDVGLRSENHKVDYSVDEGLDGMVTKAVSTDENAVSWTAAANYVFSDNMAMFARMNSGSRMPYFDDYRDNYGAYEGGNNLLQDVDQFELGFKYAGYNYSLYATGFFTKVDPSIFVALAGVTPGTIAKNEAMGVELDGNYYSDAGFNVNLNATLQSTEITAGPDKGKEAMRQPKYQVRVTPSYDFAAGDLPVTVYGTLSAVGDRYSDNGNTVTLPSYTKFDLGVIVNFNDALSFQLAADNLTDEQGLTEGDPRNPSAPNGRYILPRSVVFSVGYKF